MGLRELITPTVVNFLIERPARKHDLAAWADKLTATGAAIEARAADAKDPAAAAKTLRHITGIEKWGQRRLQVFLGEPPLQDEYDDYCPAADLSPAEQVAAFHDCRTATVALLQELSTADISGEQTVVHNDFGPLTARGWVRYLDFHANVESKRIR